MKIHDFLAKVYNIEIARIEALNSKGHDYSTDDTLSNFKRMAKLCEILNIDVQRSPADCARYLMILKVDRWCNLVGSGKKPKNESIKDTVIDLHNYVDLAYGCDIEVKRNTSKDPEIGME